MLKKYMFFRNVSAEQSRGMASMLASVRCVIVYALCMICKCVTKD